MADVDELGTVRRLLQEEKAKTQRLSRLLYDAWMAAAYPGPNLDRLTEQEVVKTLVGEGLLPEKPEEE